MAVEDAIVLANCLRNAGDVGTAFATYEQVRRARVERVVAQGKRNGDQKAPGPVARLIRDHVILPLAFKLAARGASSQRWMYDHHIDWDAHDVVSGPV